MSSDKSQTLVEVFAGTSMEANMVRSYLNNADIDSFLKDDLMGTIAPWQSSPGGAGAVKVLVSAADLERAQEIMREMKF